MSERQQGEVQIRSEMDIVTARKAVRAVAGAVGFGLTDVTRIVTAASELTRNIYHYAGTGVMTLRALNVNGKDGLELIFRDHGPGIGDLEQAMKPGYSTAGGLGIGLPGAKRLMDEMQIQSEVGADGLRPTGTMVTVRKWLVK